MVDDLFMQNLSRGNVERRMTSHIHIHQNFHSHKKPLVIKKKVLDRNGDHHFILCIEKTIFFDQQHRNWNEINFHQMEKQVASYHIYSIGIIDFLTPTRVRLFSYQYLSFEALVVHYISCSYTVVSARFLFTSRS